MRTRTFAAALIAAGLLATLTACSDGDGDTTATKSDAKPEPTPTASSPMSEPAPRTNFTVGETASINDDANGISLTATVIAYTQPVKGPQPPTASLGGDVWATAEIKVCNAGDKLFTVNQFPWVLTYEDGTRVEVTGLNGGDLPKPEFPTDDATVKPDRCVRGKIPYPVPSDKRPERVSYAPASLDEPLEWMIPAP